MPRSSRYKKSLLKRIFEGRSHLSKHLISLLVCVTSMAAATAAAYLYSYLAPDNMANVVLFYILALVIIARMTVGYGYGVACSLVSVIIINYRFTYPYYKLNFTLSGYPITFLMMAAITIILCTMTSNLTMQAKVIAEREKQLAEAEMEKMRANLLRAISHDLRTPLTGIMGNSSLILESEKDLSEEEEKSLASNIYEDASWLLNMVENLLAVTRIQGDALSITTSDEPVEEVVGEALAKLHKRYPDAEIHAQIPEEFLMLPMDAVLIEQVVINLLENAIVHSGSVRPIDFIVQDASDHAIFIVRDYGSGIPEEKLDNLFDNISYTSSNSSDAHKGMGIGLSICKTIVSAHHGTIEGRNHAEGAEFLFTLPHS